MLEVRDLRVNYQGVAAIESVSFQLQPGCLAGVIGPNGAGKSTLLQGMLGLLRSRGSVTYNGKPLDRQRQRVAYVPQRSQIDWDYPITVANVVMLGRWGRDRWWRSACANSQAIVGECLQRVEMSAYGHRQIGQLSGGQQQRVFIARALAQQADVFLLDEPFASVDKRTEAILFDVFAQLQREGKTVLVSSHQWGQELAGYDRLLLLNRCLIADDRPEIVMTLDNIQRAYGENTRSSLHSSHTQLLCC